MDRHPDNFLRGRTESLPKLLDEYKLTGCNILLAGDVPDSILTNMSASLLGDPTLQARTRVFGLFDRSEQTVHDRLDHAGYGRTPTQVVTTSAFARSKCHAQPDGGDAPDLPYVPDRSLNVSNVETDALAPVYATLVDQINTANSNYSASELRVCIDSLRPVLDTYPEETVAEFLDDLTHEIDDRRGMGHFVLPVAHDSEAVEQIKQHFDIIAPLRVEDGTPEQKWVFPNEGRTSDWFEL